MGGVKCVIWLPNFKEFCAQEFKGYQIAYLACRLSGLLIMIKDGMKTMVPPFMVATGGGGHV
jgi:hypothetical protein